MVDTELTCLNSTDWVGEQVELQEFHLTIWSSVDKVHGIIFLCPGTKAPNLVFLPAIPIFVTLVQLMIDNCFSAIQLPTIQANTDFLYLGRRWQN